MRTRKKKKGDILTTPKNISQAINYIFEGFKFFIMKHLLGTLIFLIAFCGAPGYVIISYYVTTKTAQVTQATGDDEKALDEPAAYGPPRHTFHIKPGTDSLLVKDNISGKKYVIKTDALKYIQ